MHVSNNNNNNNNHHHHHHHFSLCALSADSQVKDAHMDMGVDCGFQEVVNTETDAI
jgi:hypothetical protein